MAFAVLHLSTLFVATAMVAGFSGLMLVLTRGQGQSSVALTFWGVAMIVGAGGIICLSFEPVWGSVAKKAGNTLILLGTGLSWAGARAFAECHLKPAIVLAGPVAWLLWDTVPLQAGTPISSILALMFGSAYTIATAAELWRGRGEKLQSRMTAVVLLLVHAGVYLGRTLYVGLMPRHGWLHENDIAAALLIEALLHTIAMALLLLALMKERAELRSTVRLQELAMLDGLTGLGNRREFDRLLDHEFRRAIADRTPLGLLMIDADYFKTYNDIYGHQSGDDCLRAIAAAIRSAARRPGDAGLRYGGEEFAMLLPRTDEAGAAAVAQTILANVMALQIEHSGSPHGRVAVSIGAAVTLPNQGSNRPGKLVQAADLALYEAKIAGRNRMRMTSSVVHEKG